MGWDDEGLAHQGRSSLKQANGRIDPEGREPVSLYVKATDLVDRLRAPGTS